MPAPTNVFTLRSFLDSFQFYRKFIKDLSTLTEPLYCLLKKGVPWRWGNQEQQAFEHLKSILCTNTVLAHFNPQEQIGISCDASDVGIGAVLFHRYSLLVEKDIQFDKEEETADISTVCTIQTISQQLNTTDAGVLAKESCKDPIISAVSRYVREGWPQNIMSDQIRHHKKLEDSLS